MELLKKYFELQKQIYEYFGYKEDWVVIPLDDATGYYWAIVGGEQGGVVRYSEQKESSLKVDGTYEDDIYTQRFLPKWVYRGKDFTMVCCDPHVDGNHFLRVFDNLKEVK